LEKDFYHFQNFPVGEKKDVIDFALPPLFAFFGAAVTVALLRVTAFRFVVVELTVLKKLFIVFGGLISN